jgi:Icc-related predicted phosphoesterase
MRLQLISDLHFEHLNAAQRQGFIDAFHVDSDVVVLAGDFDSPPTLKDSLSAFASHCRAHGATLVYVMGNHDYSGDIERSDLHDVIENVVLEAGNLVWLNDSISELSGRRFLGGTLWSSWRDDNHLSREEYCDWTDIPGWPSWVPDANRKTVKFLEDNLRAGDVLVTHHLPSPRSLAHHLPDSIFARYGVSDIESLIAERQPVVALHGHVHASADYEVSHPNASADASNSARVISNPQGHGKYSNPTFDPDLVIDLQSMT